MDISIFSVTGPVMVGPSSSHTAGAARLGRVARVIAGQPFTHVKFALHGSFAETYRGHGTDRALVAGVLGLHEDDERLAQSFELAHAQGITFEFCEVQLENVHENTVEITMLCDNGKPCVVRGSSVGGGQVSIGSINGFAVEFSAEMPTLIIRQHDEKGIISDVTRLLAQYGINIGVMRLSRNAKGGTACCVIETDTALPQQLLAEIRNVPHVLFVQAFDPQEE